MNYLIWVLIGATVALFLGAGPRRRAFRPNANSSIFAGAFGALIGGILGDGVPHASSGTITIWSLVAAMLGALVFCWAVRDRASDAEP